MKHFPETNVSYKFHENRPAPVEKIPLSDDRRGQVGVERTSAVRRYVTQSPRKYDDVVDLILEVLKVQKRTRDTVGTSRRRGNAPASGCRAEPLQSRRVDLAIRLLSARARLARARTARLFGRGAPVPRRGIRGGRASRQYSPEESSFVLDVNYTPGHGDREK